MKELTCVGKPVPRVDASVKVTGDAVYGYDLSFPGMFYGKVLRSQYAHAKILNIETSKVSRLPGVRAVTTGKDAVKLAQTGPENGEQADFWVAECELEVLRGEEQIASKLRLIEDAFRRG